MRLSSIHAERFVTVVLIAFLKGFDVKKVLIRNTFLLTVVIVFCMLSVLSVLIYFNIQKRYCDLRESTARFIASDVATVIERGLRMGLHCDEMQNLPEIIKKQTALAPFVHGISVYGSSEKLLQTTLPTADRIVTSAMLQKTLTDTTGKTISVKDGAIESLLLTAKNNIGIPDIIVAVQFERFSKSEFSNLKMNLMLTVALLTLVLSIIALIPLNLIFKRINQSLFSVSFFDTKKDDCDTTDDKSIDDVKRELEGLIEDMESTDAVTRETAECVV